MLVSLGDLGADGFGEFVVVFLRLAGVGDEVFGDGVDYGKEVFGVVAAFVGVEGEVVSMGGGVALYTGDVHELLDVRGYSVCDGCGYHVVDVCFALTLAVVAAVFEELLEGKAQEGGGGAGGVLEDVGGFYEDVADGFGQVVVWLGEVGGELVGVDALEPDVVMAVAVFSVAGLDWGDEVIDVVVEVGAAGHAGVFQHGWYVGRFGGSVALSFELVGGGGVRLFHDGILRVGDGAHAPDVPAGVLFAVGADAAAGAGDAGFVLQGFVGVHRGESGKGFQFFF